MSMDPKVFREILFPNQTGTASGGQELIAVEILAALKLRGCSRLFMPYKVGSFAAFAAKHGVHSAVDIEDADSLYLGTPTIVNNTKLFPESAPGEWTKDLERSAVKAWCKRASDSRRVDTIITGLGSGDISLEERVWDMTLSRDWTIPRVFCVKQFDGFTDWLIITKRR